LSTYSIFKTTERWFVCYALKYLDNLYYSFSTLSPPAYLFIYDIDDTNT